MLDGKEINVLDNIGDTDVLWRENQRMRAKLYETDRAVMLNKEKIETALRDSYSYLAAEYGVKKIGIFGSYAKKLPRR